MTLPTVRNNGRDVEYDWVPCTVVLLREGGSTSARDPTSQLMWYPHSKDGAESTVGTLQLNDLVSIGVARVGTDHIVLVMKLDHSRTLMLGKTPGEMGDVRDWLAAITTCAPAEVQQMVESEDKGGVDTVMVFGIPVKPKRKDGKGSKHFKKVKVNSNSNAHFMNDNAALDDATAKIAATELVTMALNASPHDVTLRPVPFPSGDVRIRQISSCATHVICVAMSGSAYVWGQQDKGVPSLGVGKTGRLNIETPVELKNPFPSGQQIVRASAGVVSSALLSSSGRVAQFG